MQRLAIIELDDGNQPFCNEDRSITQVFNGEIFNAPELRSELQAKGVIGFDYVRNLGLGNKLSNKNLQLDCHNKGMHADHHDAFNFFGLASN